MTYSAPASHLPDPGLQPEFYASVPAKRLLAWAVDTLLIGLLGLLLLPLTGFLALFFLPVFYLGIGFVYRVLTLIQWSATPGMALMSIELRRQDGHRFDTPHAVLHTLGFSLSVAFVLPQLVSIFLMATGGRGQGLTDLVLGSAVINRPSR